MSGQVVAVHERIGTWARHLRARLAGHPVRLAETRSAADLEAALAGAVVPIVVVDAANRPRAALEDLGRALAAAPDALALVLNPRALPGFAWVAREVGAAHVIDGPAPPPEVARLVVRWLPLARSRLEAAGPAGLADPRPERGESPWLSALLGAPVSLPWSDPD